MTNVQDIALEDTRTATDRFGLPLDGFALVMEAMAGMLPYGDEVAELMSGANILTEAQEDELRRAVYDDWLENGIDRISGYLDLMGRAFESGLPVDDILQNAALRASEFIDKWGDLLERSFNEGSDLIDELLELFGFAQASASPLVLDLDGDGYDLLTVENATVRFDLDANSFAEATGWVGADVSDRPRDRRIIEEKFAYLTVAGSAHYKKMSIHCFPCH